MLNRSLIAVALAGALALPLAAQQTTSTTPNSNPSTPAASSSSQTTDQSSQPAAQSSSSSSQSTDQSSQPSAQSNSSSSSQGANAQPSNATSTSTQSGQSNAPADTATNQAPLSNQQHEGFWGHLNPFARKKYVQRQLSPVRDRLNELDELTASNTKLIKDVDSRATEGIRLASAKANEADMHAVDAGNRAQLANQTATDANSRLQNVQKVVTNIDQFQSSSQIEIRFRPGQTTLSKKAKGALDDMATPLKDQKGYIVEVQGFSSGRGQSAIASSNSTAESVVRYLVLNDNIPVFRIYRVGMGNAPVTDESGKAKRVYGSRVEISLLKNGIGDLSTTPAPAATNSAANSTSAPAASNSTSMPEGDQSAPASNSTGSSNAAPASSTTAPASNSTGSSSSQPSSSPSQQQQPSQPPSNQPPSSQPPQK